jgi:phosphopantetheinyl transferase
MEIASMPLGNVDGHTAGRQLLGQMYREATGQPLPEVRVTERGKPYFADGKLHFSVSHTKHRVFCVLADKPVGIDAEELGRDIDLRLAEKIVSPTEKQRLGRAEDKRLALLKLWVLKEAYAKLTGRGWGNYLYSTEFDPEDDRVREMDGCLVAVIDNNGQLTMDN